MVVDLTSILQHTVSPYQLVWPCFAVMSSKHCRIFNTGCIIDTQPFPLPVSDADHEDDHLSPTRSVASTRAHRTGKPGHN